MSERSVSSRLRWFQKTVAIPYWAAVLFFAEAALWAFVGVLRFAGWMSDF